MRASAAGVTEVHWLSEDDENGPAAEAVGVSAADTGAPAVSAADKPDAADGAVEVDDPDLSRARAIALWAARELMEYALGERTTFTVPLAPTAGTPFQQRVWAALREIPYGETRTYAEIAAAAGNPRAVRAVGQANRANPVAVIIPCHRVIGARGDLVGYDGKRVHIKARLLALEGALPGEAAVSGGV